MSTCLLNNLYFVYCIHSSPFSAFSEAVSYKEVSYNISRVDRFIFSKRPYDLLRINHSSNTSTPEEQETYKKDVGEHTPPEPAGSGVASPMPQGGPGVEKSTEFYLFSKK